MMAEIKKRYYRDGKKGIQSWQGKNIGVVVLYSRAGVAQHIWLSTHEHDILIDTGDGLLRDLLTNNFDLKRLKAIIYTHGHFDHVGGLYSLLGYLRMIGRIEPLHIFAPKGCAEVSATIDSFMTTYSDTTPFEIVYKDVLPRRVFRVAEITIEPYPVIHCGSTDEGGILDPVPALGYRLTHGDEIVAISGDTGLCSSLKGLMSGADLAIIESVYERSEDADKETLDKVHLSEDIAKNLGKLAKEFFIVHKGRRSR